MDHNKIITAAARAALKPLGLRRDGSSRVWYDDHGWWAIVVEFQPSSWSRGSYLNVGLSWMLYENSGWSFDIGHREESFRPAMGEQQFDSAMDEVAAHAARTVTKYRDRFSSPAQMYSYYRGLSDRRGWQEYHAGILAGLLGDLSSAERHLSEAVAEPCIAAWMHGRRLRCLDLIRSLRDPEWFRDSVMGIVLRCRASRGLEEMPLAEVGLP